MKLLETRKTSTNNRSLAKCTSTQGQRETNNVLYICKNKYGRPPKDVHILDPRIYDHETLHGRRTFKCDLIGRLFWVIQMGPM